jgi:hypothetical protein
MGMALKSLYVGASALAVTALVIGSYDYFLQPNEQRSLLVDVLLPLGMLVVVVLLYRRRKGEFEKTG